MTIHFLLPARPSTFATAASIFHRVVGNLSKPDYDKFTIATGSLYLASKVNEDPVRLKDMINVSQVTLNKDEALNELGNEAWILSIRDSIVQCELFIMRVLHFDPSVELPHPVSLTRHCQCSIILNCLHLFSSCLVISAHWKTGLMTRRSAKRR